MPARRSLLILLLALVSLFSSHPAAASNGSRFTAHLPALALALPAASILQRAWAYDGARIVAEFDASGAQSARFVYGTRPNVPDYMVATSRSLASSPAFILPRCTTASPPIHRSKGAATVQIHGRLRVCPSEASSRSPPCREWS